MAEKTDGDFRGLDHAGRGGKDRGGQDDGNAQSAADLSHDDVHGLKEPGRNARGI